MEEVMSKRFFLTVAVLAMVAGSHSAHAIRMGNGVEANGVKLNGNEFNGWGNNALGANALFPNALAPNALGANALASKALGATGFAVEAVTLPDGTVLPR
jgi:hypothetical protein